jgi:hypothetical protein
MRPDPTTRNTGAVPVAFAAIVLAMLPAVLDQTILATSLPTIAARLGRPLPGLHRRGVCRRDRRRATSRADLIAGVQTVFVVGSAIAALALLIVLALPELELRTSPTPASPPPPSGPGPGPRQTPAPAH